MLKPELTNEIWIKRFKDKHGDRYDYSKFEYLKTSTKSEIICKIHGSFYQKPTNHKNGRGCPTCQSIFNQPGRDKLEILKQEGEIIHKGKYDYARATYNGAMKDATITCLIHGDFRQTPQSHIVSKHGCPECAKQKRGVNRIKNAAIDFPSKAKAIHGDLYDYSFVRYTGAHNDITIVCDAHGEFSQSPTNHLSGKGCQKCNGGVPIKRDEWLEKAVENHGNFFDYSKVIFNSVTKEVDIICPEHGQFKQRASLHLKAIDPCPECRPSQRWTIERFLSAANAIHNDYYTYPNLPNEIDCNSQIDAVCPEHGEWVIPSAGGHASGHKATGCPECGLLKSGSARKITLEKVQNTFERNFGKKYNTDDVKYSNADTPIKFRCPKHGSVTIQSANLFIGDGCFDCNEIVNTKKRKSNTKDFVDECNRIHNGYYDYSKTIYRNVFSTIWIECPEHGLFKQSAVTHRKGGGCSSCASYGFDPVSKCMFYYAKINRINEAPLWMVGITKNSFKRRYSVKERASMELLKIIDFETGSEALLFETDLKRKHHEYRYHGNSPLHSKLDTELFVVDILLL